MEKSDMELKMQVEHLLQGEATIDASSIDIFAEHGFINLNGSVTSEEQKNAAEELVRSRTEAKSVFNYLVVRPIGLFGESHSQ